MKRRIKYPILLYQHFINEESDNMDSRTTGYKFEQDIKSLIENDYTSISLEDLFAFENDEKELLEKSFIITIDDGYLSNYEIAFPILKKYHVFADIFIVTDFIGLKTHPDFPMLIPHFGYEHANEMLESGLVKIHSHGKFHKSNIVMDDDSFIQNINESMQLINKLNIYNNFICYAYPDGKFNDKTINMVKHQGYNYQLIPVNKLTFENINEGCLGRINVGYHSNITSLLQTYNYIVDDISRKSNQVETLMIDDSRLNKFENIKAVLKTCQTKYENRNKYNIKSIKYDGINVRCNKDELMLYYNKETTAKQSDNYEIIINQDNRIVSDNYNGCSIIPKGGYVLSGNGIAKNILKSIYELNVNAYNCEAEKKIIIIKTPEHSIQKSFILFEQIKDEFDNAKKKYLNIDYLKIEKSLKNVEKIINNCRLAIDTNKYNKALQLSTKINMQINIIRNLMIPSKAIENRALWYRSDEKSDDDVRKVIERVSSLNINAIYLETWYDGKFIGFSNNPLVKHQEWFNGDFDALEAFCRIGHIYGIEIHAWVENFFIGTKESALIDDDNLVNKMKGKLLLDRNNNDYNQTIYGNYVFLNPYDDYCRNFILDLYNEMLSKYDVDGIHLDYMRFPDLNYGKYDYGYNEDIILGFHKKYNTDVDVHLLYNNDEIHIKWCKYREDIINSFVKKVYELTKRLKPSIWISCACYPNIDITSKTNFQNLSEWVKNGWIDEAFSMSYSDNCLYIGENVKSFVNICNDKVSYSIGLDAFEDIPASNLIKQIEVARNYNIDGIALFALNYITKDNYENILKNGVFKNKSSQTYKIDKIITIGINDILKKITNISLYYNLSYDDFLKEIYNRCLMLSDKANNLDFFKADTKTKIEYLKELIDYIKLIIELIDDSNICIGLKTSLKNDFLFFNKQLNKNKNSII